MLSAEVRGTTLIIELKDWIFPTTIEDSPETMEYVISELIRFKGIERVVIREAREIEYDKHQTNMLKEINLE